MTGVRLALLRRFARLIIGLEATARVLWLPLCWTALSGGLWLLQAPALFGHAAEIFFVIVFWGGFVLLVWHGLVTEIYAVTPSPDRRLEKASGLENRPLEQITDRPANLAYGETGLLWDRHREQSRRAIAALRWPRPRFQLAHHDPLALRVAALLFVMLAALMAGGDALPRLQRGLWPFNATTEPVTAAADDGVVLWITPPAYTHKPRLALTAGRLAKPVTIPAGSIVQARWPGGWLRPSLSLGRQSAALDRIGNGVDKIWAGQLTAKTKTDAQVTLSLRQGLFTRLRAHAVVTADRPPQIAIKAAPQPTPKGALQMDVTVRDDYGVTALLVSVAPDPQAPPPALGAPQTWHRAVAGVAGKDTELKPVFDLTGHPWAGHSVLLTIAAQDGAGQVTALAPVQLTLPERRFENPAAQQIAALRRTLIDAPHTPPIPVAAGIEDVLAHVGLYGGDPVTFLTLRSAASRLIWDRGPGAVPGVVGELWQAALRMDDGGLSLTAQTLREAQDKLQALLAQPDATPAQLAAAVETVRAALNDHLRQLYMRLMQQAAAQGQKPPSPQDFARQVDAEQLAGFLDRLQAKAMGGDRDAARAMLQQLQELSDRLDPATAQPSPQMRAALQALQDLRNLLDGQKDVQEKTRQAKTSGTSATGQKAAQEALRKRLGDLMRKLDGPIPAPLQKAEQSMRSASAGLGANRPDAAIAAQDAAIGQLQQAGKGMAQQLKQMLAQGQGPADPLGRPLGDGESLSPESDVKVPDQAERRQAQDILRLLRERSGDQSRPEYELDYYRRLMEQF